MSMVDEVALANIGEVLADASMDIGPVLTCAETNTLARALATTGHVAYATALVYGHAQADEGSYVEHYSITSMQAAAEYVMDDLLGGTA